MLCGVQDVVIHVKMCEHFIVLELIVIHIYLHKEENVLNGFTLVDSYVKEHVGNHFCYSDHLF